MTGDRVVLILWRGEGFGVPADPPSAAFDPRDRIEEDLAFAARDTMQRAIQILKRRGASWQEAAMHANNPVADYYGVDRDALLGAWIRHYMPSELQKGNGS